MDDDPELGYPICDECNPGDTYCGSDGVLYDCERGNCWMANGTCTPPPPSPSITIQASGCPVAVGNVFTLYGILLDASLKPIAGATVGLYSSMDGGAGVWIANVVTDGNGHYTLNVDSTQAYWGAPGHDNEFYAQYGNVHSGSVYCGYSAASQSTSLTALVDKSSVAAKGAVTISGRLTNASGAGIGGLIVRVQYAKPSCENPCVVYQVTTDYLGNYSITVSGADTSEAGTNSGWAVFLSQSVNGVTYQDSNMAYFDFTVTDTCPGGVNPSTCYGTSSCQYGLDTQYCDNGHLLYCEQRTDCLGCWVNQGSCNTPPPELYCSIHVSTITLPTVTGGPTVVGGWAFTSQGAVPAGLPIEVTITGPKGFLGAQVLTDSSGSFKFNLDGSFVPVAGNYTINVRVYAATIIGNTMYDQQTGQDYNSSFAVIDAIYPTVLVCLLKDANNKAITQVTQGGKIYVQAVLQEGTVSALGPAIQGASVSLYAKSPGASTWTLIGTATTDSNGFMYAIYDTIGKPIGTYQFYALFAGTAPASGYPGFYASDYYAGLTSSMRQNYDDYELAMLGVL